MTFARGAVAWLLVLVLALASACVDPETPVAAVPTLDDVGTGSFVAVAVGDVHSCALAADGTAYCWGSDEFGQLGVGGGAASCPKGDRHIPCERTPRVVAGGLKFQRLSAGARHTCGVGQDARVYCWGDNLHGQLGDPALRQSAVPAPILNTALYTDVAAGDRHSCAIRSDAVAVCWGANDNGQLGVATVGTGSAAPVVMQTTLRFASLAAGARRTCARQADGISYCWGAHWVGRGTDGAEITRPQAQPIRVNQAPALHSVSVGSQTTCGLGQDAIVYCWEANPTGAIGDGTTFGSLVPNAVASTLRFTSVTVGLSQTCAIADTGFAYCWGSDAFGQLGVSPSTISRRCDLPVVPCVVSPSRISGWRRFSRIATGLGAHVCAVSLAGNVYCWGSGTFGQRGDARSISDWVPVQVAAP